MYRLRNPLQRYAWGSVERIPRFLGVEPDGTPQAELWMGAHRAAPSSAFHDGVWVPLPDLLAADPDVMLGRQVTARFGAELPFLFKVLAAAEPLSLQVHPDAAQAQAGFAREEAGGLAAGDPRRNYRDPNHKPEILCALDPFDVLTGFRPAAPLVAVLEAFGIAALLPGSVAATGDAAAVCDALWDLGPDERRRVTATVVAAAASGAPAERRFPAEAAFVRRAAGCHPGDVGVAVGLCLNQLRLAPGQALFAAAGMLHAYLDGFGVELMANSDNVVRAGLTTKAVDVDELRRLLVAGALEPEPLTATVDGSTGELRYPAPVDEFALSVLTAGTVVVGIASPGPEILLCTAGEVVVRGAAGTTIELRRGQSVFVPAAEAAYGLTGEGSVHRAQVGLHVDRPA